MAKKNEQEPGKEISNRKSYRGQSWSKGELCRRRCREEERLVNTRTSPQVEGQSQNYIGKAEIKPFCYRNR